MDDGKRNLTLEMNEKNQFRLPTDRSYTFNVHQHSSIDLWPAPFDHTDPDGFQRQNLTVDVPGGQLALYGLTAEQLGTLYVQIGELLGKKPNATQFHLRKCRDLINELLNEGKPNG